VTGTLHRTRHHLRISDFLGFTPMGS
jgi:hypothetical protein